MHILHLAIIPDVMGSMLLLLTDTLDVWNDVSREKRLGLAYESYRLWCESAGWGVGKTRNIADKVPVPTYMVCLWI